MCISTNVASYSDVSLSKAVVTNVPADAGWLCDRSAQLRDIIKRTTYKK
jgi:hypothetical protein